MSSLSPGRPLGAMESGAVTGGGWTGSVCLRGGWAPVYRLLGVERGALMLRWAHCAGPAVTPLDGCIWGSHMMMLGTCWQALLLLSL